MKILILITLLLVGCDYTETKTCYKWINEELKNQADSIKCEWRSDEKVCASAIATPMPTPTRTPFANWSVK